MEGEVERKKTGKINHFYLDNNFGARFRKKEVKESGQGYFICMKEGCTARITVKYEDKASSLLEIAPEILR